MKKNTKVCPACGWSGVPKKETPGSIFIELVLWLAFLVPGLVYSLWRMSARREVCAECRTAPLVPATSPVGRELLARFAEAGS